MTTETFNQAQEATSEIRHHEHVIKQLSDTQQRLNDFTDPKNYNTFYVGAVAYPATVGNKVIEYLLDFHKSELSDAQSKLFAL